LIDSEGFGLGKGRDHGGKKKKKGRGVKRGGEPGEMGGFRVRKRRGKTGEVVM